MKKLTLTFAAVLTVLIVCGQLRPNGVFVGLEKIEGYPYLANPKYTWYHLSVLTFTRDSVFLEQSPVAIYKTDTIFSASDGGFYSYAGTVSKYEGKTVADLKLKSCDYCELQMIEFTPPKIVQDEDTVQAAVDTITAIQPEKFEKTNRKYKILILEKSTHADMLIINKSIYKRRRK